MKKIIKCVVIAATSVLLGIGVTAAAPAAEAHAGSPVDMCC